jgi:4-aminobutyrate aminotransferase
MPAAQETAAVILEPILGEGGFLVPPPGFLSALRALCDCHGMLLIFDEVQSGVARTGKWWGHQHLTDAQPDMLLFAKGIASGVPFAGVSARPELYDRMGPGMMVRAVGRSHTGCCWGG